MNGAESLMRVAVDLGVDVCFANPGTTEMHLVAALDEEPGVRAVLGLFEGVCTGAADGYGRMTARPAMTLLHLGPGLANGLANLHNARRARTPVVNLVGDHATWHLDADAPLTSDIVSLASPVSSWVRTTAGAKGLPGDFYSAFVAATGPPGSVATLIVPADAAWEHADPYDAPTPDSTAREVGSDVVAAAAEAVTSGSTTVLFLGGSAMNEQGQRAAAAIGAATGCRLMHETFVARHERGAGRPHLRRLAYFPEAGQAELDGAETIVLAGAPEPVGFFGYEGGTSRIAPDGADRLTLAEPGEDAAAALVALVEELGAPPVPVEVAAPPERPTGTLDIATMAQAIAATQPEGAIVVDEAATSGLAYPDASAAAPPFDVLQLTGGAIGQGLPVAVGAAVACPDRRVIAFQADGSGMYTLQSLWTMAREQLDVTVVLCANRSYAILKYELFRAGISEPGPQAESLTELSGPHLDWVSLGTGMGVPSVSVTTTEELLAALDGSFREPGPTLIEVVLG